MAFMKCLFRAGLSKGLPDPGDTTSAVSAVEGSRGHPAAGEAWPKRVVNAQWL